MRSKKPYPAHVAIPFMPSVLKAEYDPTFCANANLDSMRFESSQLASNSRDLPKIPLHLHKEAPREKSIYGATQLGQSCLGARQCVENGARFVTVVDEGWDLHDDLHVHLKENKLPALDTAYSGLLTSLDRRGLLKETLVVVMGEFGRTPEINEYGGRDHWPEASCALIAGGPFQKGAVIGQTDETGSAPTGNPSRLPN